MLALRALHAPADGLEVLAGRRDPMTPPNWRFRYIGGGDFRGVGDEFLRHFVELGGLVPKSRVLDVGCGIGRMAVALTKYLDPSGSYDGFDIVADGIRWCERKITPRYPNFRFSLADVFNTSYRPRGAHPASEYEFPYPDGAFDFVFVTSVFTHMLPADVENYASEIARVTRPGGRCLITWFLLTDESLRAIEEGKSALQFSHVAGGYRAISAEVPERAIAFPEQWVRGLYARCGLSLVEPMRYGSWCGREGHLSYQDIAVARKPPRPEGETRRRP